MDLEELRNRHIRQVDKFYRMYSNLASDIICFENLTIELEILVGEKYNLQFHTAKGTVIQLVKSWMVHPELKDAKRYVVHLYKTDGSTGFAFNNLPAPGVIYTEIHKMQDPLKIPEAVIEGEINIKAEQRFVAEIKRLFITKHPKYDYLHHSSDNSLYTLDQFDIEKSGTYFTNEQFFLKSEPVLFFEDKLYLHGIFLIHLPHNIGLLVHRFLGEEQYTLFGLVHGLSEHINSVCLEVIKEQITDKIKVYDLSYKFLLEHEIFEDETNKRKILNWYNGFRYGLK